MPSRGPLAACAPPEQPVKTRVDKPGRETTAGGDLTAMEGQRLNMYTEIHKGIRQALFDFAALVGGTDWTEPDARADAEQSWAQLKDLLRDHVENERQYAHPLYEATMPSVARQLNREHEEQELYLDELAAHFDRLVALDSPDEQVAMGLEFYRRLHLFISDYLPHLQREEGVHMRNLWDLYDDDELSAVYATILNALSIPMLQFSSRLILQAASHQDLLAMMGAVGPLLQSAVREQMFGYARQYLPPRKLEKLMRAMEAQEAAAPA